MREYDRCVELVKQFVGRYELSGRGRSDLDANLSATDGQVDRSLDDFFAREIKQLNVGSLNREQNYLTWGAFNVWSAAQYAACGSLHDTIRVLGKASGYFAAASCCGANLELYEILDVAARAETAFLADNGVE